VVATRFAGCCPGGGPGGARFHNRSSTAKAYSVGLAKVYSFLTNDGGNALPVFLTKVIFVVFDMRKYPSENTSNCVAVAEALVAILIFTLPDTLTAERRMTRFGKSVI
jgi:hypothetical protein